MNTYQIIARNIYIIFTIIMAGSLYLYITKDLNGDSFIGYCFFAISCVLSFTIYQSTVSLYQSFMAMKSKQVTTSAILTESVEFAISRNQEECSYSIPCKVEEVPEQNGHEMYAATNKEHSEDESLARQETIQDLSIYTQNLLGKYFPEADMDSLVQILTDYAEGKSPTPILRHISELNGLKPKDLYHYGWNIWVRLKPMNRRSTCVFLKKAFPHILEGSSIQTIYSKMMDDCYMGAVRNIALHEDLSLSYHRVS